MERILPLSVDERSARKENVKLGKGEAVEVRLEDNHIVHLRENSKAGDTEATRAHLQAHDEAMVMKRLAPQVFPTMPQDMPFNPESMAERPKAEMERGGQQGQSMNETMK